MDEATGLDVYCVDNYVGANLEGSFGSGTVCSDVDDMSVAVY